MSCPSAPPAQPGGARTPQPPVHLQPLSEPFHRESGMESQDGLAWEGSWKIIPFQAYYRQGYFSLDQAAKTPPSIALSTSRDGAAHLSSPHHSAAWQGCCYHLSPSPRQKFLRITSALLNTSKSSQDAEHPLLGCSSGSLSLSSKPDQPCILTFSQGVNHIQQAGPHHIPASINIPHLTPQNGQEYKNSIQSKTLSLFP